MRWKQPSHVEIMFIHGTMGKSCDSRQKYAGENENDYRELTNNTFMRFNLLLLLFFNEMRRRKFRIDEMRKIW